MSIARAFTTRRARQTLDFKERDPANSPTGGSSNFPSSVDSFLHRSKTAKVFTTHRSIRHKISSPVELTHTTNMLSYNAPNISGSENSISIKAAPSTAATAGMMAAAAAPLMATSPVSVSGSTGIKSDDEVSDSGETNASTPPTSPDTPFPRDDDTHKNALSLEPNHLSCYFMPPNSASQTPSNDLRTASSGAPNVSRRSSSPPPFTTTSAPAIPRRAPSHTKKLSFDGLGRHHSSRMSEASRSLSSKGSFSFSRSSSTSTSTSISSSASHRQSMKPVISAPLAVSSSVPLATTATAGPAYTHKKEYSESHPFGQELAKVSELVEEFKDDSIVEEELELELSNNPLYMEEEHEMVVQGLKKYSAESYMSDIQSLVNNFFAAERPIAVWI